MNFNDYEPNSYRETNHYSYLNNNGSSDEVVSIGMWIGILILTAIPFVNIIAVLYMAFGASNENIKNFGKASLIMIGISLLFLLLFGGCSYTYRG